MQKEEPSIEDLNVDYDFFNNHIKPTLGHRIPALEALKVWGQPGRKVITFVYCSDYKSKETIFITLTLFGVVIIKVIIKRRRMCVFNNTQPDQRKQLK